MKIHCASIAQQILDKAKLQLGKVYDKKAPPKVALVYVGSDPLTEIFIQNKIKLANALNIRFEVIHFSHVPLFQQFASKLRITANDRNFHAVLVQRPLPPELNSISLDNFIPRIKEVEGQKYKSPYISPIGKAALSLLKYVHTQDWRIKSSDVEFFKKTFKRQFVVIAGRGETAGKPLASTLLRFKIPTIITHSATDNCDMFYSQADVLITATGSQLINDASCIKQGAILLNFGYRKEDGVTKGDYDEKAVRDVAGYYTPVVNGSGPIMLAYLMENIVSAYTASLKLRSS
ncbi:MAG: bifunctional 5,10-methylenetetrahydrofolate dehydrogenase/5,10-methenyltetrahydrofolate cyclohydrolase [Candidatus Roizmanbacteria bacterium]|nr:bifunctional 5,10-methylenetetrahydrofolate dehydrogenase/5,10-methenyltetrahydrofolate cyclohydrolase [Candidatus Roizmanbacteria bacterium]